MTREIIGAIALSLVAVIATLIFLSNRSVRKAQEAALPMPTGVESVTQGIAGYYVSTVFWATPLKRVWAWGLGGRGKALIEVSETGIAIERSGEVGLYIPAEQLVGATRASATIDKGVEKDGLLVLIWKLGNEELATHLRIVAKSQRKQLEEDLRTMLGVEIA